MRTSRTSFGKVIAKLIRYGPVNSASEFMRVVRQAGRDPKYRYGNTLRGMCRYSLDSSVRANVDETASSFLWYREIDHEHPFSKNGGTGQIKTVSRLISQGPLKDKKLKVFDAACNHGYLVEHIPTPERYIGMDIIEETINTANREAPKRFEELGCNNYKFIAGDILDPESYKDVPQDNNVIVCTGIVGLFRPQQIKKLLSNLNQILAYDKDARIYFGFPVIHKDHFDNKLVEKKFDENIPYVMEHTRIDIGNRVRVSFRCYDPEKLIEFISSNCGFEIDWQNSDIRLPAKEEHLRSIHLCIKKKN